MAAETTQSETLTAILGFGVQTLETVETFGFVPAGRVFPAFRLRHGQCRVASPFLILLTFIYWTGRIGRRSAGELNSLNSTDGGVDV